jgi:transcriptional regulator with XRE-family HTH domain
MEGESSPVELRLAARLHALRVERGLTLDGLAELAGVSRSMISLIERGESSPTASVLDRLAVGLGMTLAALFAEERQVDAAPLARRAEQPVWCDPETGYVRRNLSPPGYRSLLELVEIVLPAGARVTYDTGIRSPAVDQQVWMLEGSLRLTLGETVHELEPGDCLAMRLDRPTGFHNPWSGPARYLVALTSSAQSMGPGRAVRSKELR